MKLKELNSLYHTEFGETAAETELLPLLKKYLKPGHKILEVGCGYGRNFRTYSHFTDNSFYGCDIDQAELDKASKKISELGLNNLELKQQTNPDKLPYESECFDFIILWQVLEHVIKKKDKKRLMSEVARVIKNGGLVLIQTPNFWFPIDYHDNNIPLAHWLLPDKLRHLATKYIRQDDYPPSQYTTSLRLAKYLRLNPAVTGVEHMTKIFFQESYASLFINLGATRRLPKMIFFTLYYPLYATLRFLGLPGDLLAPSVRSIFKVSKRK